MDRRPLTASEETHERALSITSMPAAQMRRVAERLVGVLIPSVVLCGNGEYSLNLQQFAYGYPLIVYLYPGCESPLESDGGTALMDARSTARSAITRKISKRGAIVRSG